MKTIQDAAAALAAGHASAAALTEQALARIADPAGEGKRAFTKVHADRAMASARAMDAPDALRTCSPRTVRCIGGIFLASPCASAPALQ